MNANLPETQKEPPRRALRIVLFFLAMGGAIVAITGLTVLLIYNSAKPTRHDGKALASNVKVSRLVSLQSESNYPYGLVPAPDGEMYLTIFGNGTIYKVDQQGQLSPLTVINSSLRAPGAAVVGADGSLYVIDYTAPALESVGRIKQITPDGKISSFGVTPRGTDLSLFAQMTFDGTGNLYVTSPSTAEVWQIAPGGTSRVWWAVPPVNNTAAQPTGIVYDASHNAMIIGDAGTGTIYRVTVTTDGKASDSLVIHRETNQEVQALTLDDQNRVLYAVWDHDNGQVNRLENDGSVTALADGFREPTALVYRNHMIYVANSDLLGITPPLFGVIPSPFRARPPFTVDVMTLGS